MKRSLACLGLLLAMTIGARGARAQPPGPDEVDCDYWSTISFDTGSGVVNLDSQAQLNQALQWLFDAPGRYVYILGSDGPRSSDARLGQVRVNAVTTFLVANGASAGAVIRGNFGDLRSSRLQAGLRASDIVVMGCQTAALTD
jgi:hypothetical protein